MLHEAQSPGAFRMNVLNVRLPFFIVVRVLHKECLDMTLYTSTFAQAENTHLHKQEEFQSEQNH